MAIPKARLMAELVEPFEVRSRLTGESWRVTFSHLWVGIATRHSDTIDCKFLVNGRGVVVGVAHLGLVDFHERTGRHLNDGDVAQIAAAFLRERLAADQDTDRNLLFVPREEALRLLGLS